MPLSPSFPRSWGKYSVLPTTKHDGFLGNQESPTTKIRTRLGQGLPRRYSRLLLSLVVLVGMVGFWELYAVPTEPQTGLPPYPAVQDISPEDADLPPVYESYRQYEDDLSTSKRDLTNGRYLFFANHAWGCGWGNALQEMLFSNLLAYEAGRGFVWDDYTWNMDGSKYTQYNGKPIPSTIPLSTMLSGHIFGLDQIHSSIPQTNLSISRRVYETLCPPERRKLVARDAVTAYLNDVHPKVDDFDNAAAEEVLEAWLGFLNQPHLKDEPCLEVQAHSPQVFDIWLFGSTKVQNIWDRLASSPLLTKWAWSPLIHRAFDKNKHIFVDINPASKSKFLSGLTNLIHRPVSPNLNQGSNANGNATKGLPQPVFNPATDFTSLPILALHIRRGDFSEHCTNLADWGAAYTGINSFPEFGDGFRVPRVDGNTVSAGFYHEDDDNESDPEVVPSKEARRAVYAKHCFPDVDMIVKRVRHVVRDYERVLKVKEVGKGWLWHWNRQHAKTLDSPSLSPPNGVDRTKDILFPRSTNHHVRTSTTLAKRHLRKIYIMTNGDREWLEKVKDALKRDAERSKSKESGWEFEWDWDLISTSRDLTLGWEEKPVGQALDMYVAQRAEVFVGNGFSSLTSNIVMLRKKAGLDPVQTRFW